MACFPQLYRRDAIFIENTGISGIPQIERVGRSRWPSKPYIIIYIYINHKSNFKTRNPKNSTRLSKHIWKLEDENIGYDVSWKIVSRAKPYNHVTNTCQLCTREKFFIIFKPEMASINERNEIAGPCLHKHSKLLKKSKS